MQARRILVAGLAVWVAWLVPGYRYHFIDGVNLAFHEAGHLLFGPLGPTLGVLGGTLGQLLVPLACGLDFLRRARRFEAAVCGVWLAESLMYTARYMGDARALALPLVGGHVHDWNWLLARSGLLHRCEALAAALHALASLLAVAALIWAAREVMPSSGARGVGAQD